MDYVRADGRDLNVDGVIDDIAERAFALDGFDADGTARFNDIGACAAINCGRGAAFSQLNVRVSKVFVLPGTVRLEAIGEIFNLFNAKNPAQFERASANTQARVLVGGEPNRSSCSPSDSPATSSSPSS